MNRFYIWMNVASTENHYWSQPAQNWTTDPFAATLFDTEAEGEGEAVYADAYGPGEVFVRQQTKPRSAAAHEQWMASRREVLPDDVDPAPRFYG